ncbi:MAG TPA: hypothetical protein VK041_10190 [Opitutales bacterium]|nr:hypothetical protein [Opitutales bacterium]
MNPRLLLALSLALNAGLGTLLILQTASRPSPPSDSPQLLGNETFMSNGDANESVADPDSEGGPDYRRLFAALRATGLPRDEIEQILRGAALSDWQDDLRGLRGLSLSGRMDEETLRELIELRRAREAALSQVTGKEEFLITHGWMLGDAWDEIPPGKQKAVVMLEEDYQLLLAEAGASSSPEANDAIRLLHEERLQDLSSILTDSELAVYDRLAHPELESLGPASPASEIADNRLPQPAAPAASSETAAPMPREADPAFQELVQLTDRFEIAPERAAEIYELRRVVQEQRDRLSDDPDLTAEEREATIRYLTNDAREVVRVLLGEEAFSAYLESDGAWLSNSPETD